MMKHIIFDILSIWTVSAIAFFAGFWYEQPMFWFWDLLLSIYFLGRTSRWILYLYDKAFNKLCTVKTKSYRYLSKMPYYFFATKYAKLRYSELRFYDPKLKGRFIHFENDVFRSGDLLEMTYYKNSKVIKSIEKIDL